AIGPAQSCDPISCILSVHPLSLNSRWPAVYPILTQWDGGRRRFILIQIPELCALTSLAYKAGFRTVSEIGKERIRRVIKRLGDARQLDRLDRYNSEETSKDNGDDPDLGFKVFKLDSSNIKTWDPDYGDLANSLLGSVDNIKDDRSDLDVLYELLLKQGLDLAIPIEERSVAGQRVYIVGGGALVVCLG